MCRPWGFAGNFTESSTTRAAKAMNRCSSSAALEIEVFMRKTLARAVPNVNVKWSMNDGPWKCNWTMHIGRMVHLHCAMTFPRTIVHGPFDIYILGNRLRTDLHGLTGRRNIHPRRVFLQHAAGGK